MVPMSGKRASRVEPKPLISKSVFTLTFVVEVVGLDVWHDCNEGWIDLELPLQGVKLTYQLFPGQTFVVFCGSNYGWVRTWQFLERRWLAFSIRHAFPVKVLELRNFEATVVPTFGLNALDPNIKTGTTAEVYLPRLQFGERRQFGKVIEFPISEYIVDIIWLLVVKFIPSSIMDGLFETPYPVHDVRHQDAAIYRVKDAILNHYKQKEEEQDEENKEVIVQKRKISYKVQKKTSFTERNPNEIALSGDWILAGVGRVIPFVRKGECPKGQGEVIALISSVNLPAQDDFPTFFVNICNLSDIPIEHLEQNRFTHIYTRWSIGDEKRNSEQQSLLIKPSRTEVNFNDHHSVPLPCAAASDIMATFLDEPFRVEVRGIRTPPPLIKTNKFFGYEKADRDWSKGIIPPLPDQTKDILIAHTQIDARALTKINGFVKGEFPLYPPQTTFVPMEREEVCTNDINAVRAKVEPDLFIQPGVILGAQMLIEVSMGIVGCKPKSNAERYSRLYCLISDREAIMALLRQISEINESAMQINNKSGLLTGFALDTGDTVILFVEGKKEGQILRVWERTEDHYPNVKPVFSTSAKYNCRLYPELLLAAMPFNIMKMAVPLSVLLSLTPIYVRPALPLPTRSAVLKLGRLVASKFKAAPSSHLMPTAPELKSFRLELCVAPRPPPVYNLEIPRQLPDILVKRESTAKVLWHPNENKCSPNPKGS